jgi:hypothetical protein
MNLLHTTGGCCIPSFALTFEETGFGRALSRSYEAGFNGDGLSSRIRSSFRALMIVIIGCFLLSLLLLSLTGAFTVPFLLCAFVP